MRSLAALDLARMRPLTEPAQRRVDLDDDGTRRLISALADSSRRAVDGLVSEVRHRFGCHARRGDATTHVRVLHHLMTHKRFRRGPRGNYPVAALAARTVRHIRAGEPVPVALQGFPFKQCDNGLKAAGPLPDIADLGALLRLVELQRAFAAHYPPGLGFTVMFDGGYHRPRPRSDLDRYRDALARLERIAGVHGALTWHDKNDLVAQALGAAADEREAWIARYEELISRLVQPAVSGHDSRWADELIQQAGPSALPPRIPSFSSLHRSLVYSVPVPSPAGRPCPEWSRIVLAGVLLVDDPAASAAVRLARRSVLRTAWRDTVRYLAVAAADVRCEVDRALAPHVRLRTGITGPGEIGLTYLGGSALLPWHGSGCVDRRGQVAVDFRVVHHDRGMAPVHCPVTGADQPFMMAPPSFVAPGGGLIPDLMRQIRLRRR